MTEQEAHRKTEIAWMRANLSDQAFRDWYWAEYEPNRNWMDELERQVLESSKERLNKP